MKNLKTQLTDYLAENGKDENLSYRELYDIFPFDGNDLSKKQKGDRVRSIWKGIKKGTKHVLHSIYDPIKCAELIYANQSAHHNPPEVIHEKSLSDLPKPKRNPVTYDVDVDLYTKEELDKITSGGMTLKKFKTITDKANYNPDDYEWVNASDVFPWVKTSSGEIPLALVSKADLDTYTKEGYKYYLKNKVYYPANKQVQSALPEFALESNDLYQPPMGDEHVPIDPQMETGKLPEVVMETTGYNKRNRFDVEWVITASDKAEAEAQVKYQALLDKYSSTEIPDVQTLKPMPVEYVALTGNHMGTTPLPEIVMEKEGYNKYQPTEDGNYLILGCVHAPFVNKPFWEALCNYALLNKDYLKGVILNGDFLDLNSLSSHDRGRMPLEGVSIGWEYKESQKLLKQLTDNLLPDAYQCFLYGNHENRQQRYMSTPDGKKLEGGVLVPEEGLNLSKDWNVFTDWKNDEVQLGDLSIIHGEFFSVHLCKKYLDTFKKNMLFAHSHRQQLYREGDHVAYNIGCMLDINSSVFNYASKAMKKTWANGFALATLDNRNTNVQLVTWNKDHFLIGNEKYK
jgi:hypothetical protein